VTLAALLVLTITPQFSLLAFLLAVLAAVLAVRPTLWHGARAARVGALLCGLGVWHRSSPSVAKVSELYVGGTRDPRDSQWPRTVYWPRAAFWATGPPRAACDPEVGGGKPCVRSPRVNGGPFVRLPASRRSSQDIPEPSLSCEGDDI